MQSELNENETQSYAFIIVFLRLLFLKQFEVPSEIQGKVQQFPIYSFPPTCTASLTANILHQSGAFVAIDDPALTNHYPWVQSLHQGSLLGLHSLRVWANVWWHVFLIRASCRGVSLPSQPPALCLFIPPPPTPWQLLTFLLSPRFYILQNGI